jgi:undecaprenyl diphosphate synthase
MNHNIKHLAIIMDGNARWASSNNLPKSVGHQRGAETAKKLMPDIIKLGIDYLTLYAFSSENWQRPEDEVSWIMKLLSYYVENEVKTLHKNNIKLKIIGNLEKLNDSLKEKVIAATKLTENNDKMTVCIAIGYGGRAEIVDACQKIINSGIKQISQEDFRNFLYDPTMPDVDLLIRPSGVYRISNFLLWQVAYAELFFTDKFWPDFSINDIKEAVDNYSTRKRNFGGR